MTLHFPIKLSRSLSRSARLRVALVGLFSLLVVACTTTTTTPTEPVQPAGPKTYTVTFDTDGGSAVAPQTVVSGTNAVRPKDDPTRAGYAFDDWYGDQKKSMVFNFNTAITNDLTVYAKWIKLHTVAFNTGGGSAVAPQTITNGDKAKQPTPDPMWTGRTFQGWFTSAEAKVVFNFNTAITNDLTIYAGWNLKSYTVTFATNSAGAEFTNQVVKHESKVTPLKSDPKRSGFAFDGWFKDSALKQAFNFNTDTITADLTLYAKWIVTYTVSFNTAGGNVVPSQTIGSNRMATQPGNPSKSGDFFAGWFIKPGTKDKTFKFDFDTVKITSNTTVYAAWTDKGATVIFTNFNGLLVETQSIAFGEKATRPAKPVSNGYDFIDWYTAQTGGTLFNFDLAINVSNTIVYARWIKTFTVGFATNEGGTVALWTPQTQTVRQGSNATRPANNPTRVSHDFVDWFTSAATNTKFNFGLAINADTTIYAGWKKKTYTVNFNTGTGGSAVAAQTIAHGEKAATPSPAPTRTGFTFKGWFTTAETNTGFNFNNPITSAATAYASWEQNTYTVTFNSGGGSAVAAQRVLHGSNAVKPADDPTRANFDFKGWHADTAGTTPFSFDTVKITSNTTVYAKWQGSVYTVSFTNLGGVELAKQSVAALAKATKPADPVSNGYSFLGWYTTTNALTAATPTFNFDTAITSSTNLYARWIKTFTVGFATNQGGATVLWPGKSQTVRQGSNAVKPAADPTRVSHNFAGWFTSTATNAVFNFGTAINADTTIYAGWELKSYAVTFITNTATPSAPAFTVQRVLHSSNAVAPSPAPTRTGFTFKGWFTTAETNTKFDFASFAITSATNVYASWELNTYTVTFITNVGDPNFAVQTIKHGSNAVKPATDPTRTDFIFGGWYADTAGTTPFNLDAVKITSNTAVYARWVSTFVVTFNTDGGSPVAVQRVGNNGKVVKPTDPTRADRAFVGWYKDSARIIPFDFATERITGDITLYALWGYEVTYELGSGGTLASVGSGTVKKAVTANTNLTFLRSPYPTRGGNHFGGWYKDAGLSEYFFPELEPVTNNLLLYAKWQAHAAGGGNFNPPVNFDMRGGSPVLWPLAYGVNTQWGAVKNTLPAISNRTNSQLAFTDWRDDSGIIDDPKFLRSINGRVYPVWASRGEGISLAAANSRARGLAYYDRHLYVLDENKTVYAYHTNGARASSKDFTLTNAGENRAIVHVSSGSTNGFYVMTTRNGFFFYGNDGNADPSKNIAQDGSVGIAYNQLAYSRDKLYFYGNRFSPSFASLLFALDLTNGNKVTSSAYNGDNDYALTAADNKLFMHRILAAGSRGPRVESGRVTINELGFDGSLVKEVLELPKIASLKAELLPVSYSTGLVLVNGVFYVLPEMYDTELKRYSKP